MTDRTPSRPSKPRAKTQKAPSPRRKPRQVSKAAKADGSRTDPAVIGFLRDLEHPLKVEIEAVRQLILEVSPEVRESIKWNAPSFHTTDHFATFKLRPEDRVTLILHTGAKVKATARTGVKVADPAGLLEWLAKDRCMVTFQDAKDIQARGPALQAVLREWLRYL
ncbi:MAG TPA: DUF1801 domain-containing protein [Myxococcus sp.]|nr:DUF1801 domain-containing protein [Myxococcus sp.]